MGFIQSVESLNRTKKAEDERIHSLHLIVFELGHWSSPTLRLKHTPLALLVLRPLDLD